MKPLKIGDNRICFFNSELIDAEKTTANKIWYKPHEEEILVKFDAEWEGGISYPYIVKVGDKYRMYYMTGKMLSADRSKVLQDDTYKTCFMESDDMLHWSRPSLGVCEYNGSKNNNIVYNKPYEFFMFKDTNPNCKKGEEFKVIYNITGQRVLHCAYSSDGIRFEEGGMISDKASFDTLNLCFYDPKEERYVAYVRGFHKCGGGEFASKREALETPQKVRDVRIMYSKDFKTWSDPEPANIPIDVNYEIYCACLFRYYNAEQYLIGFPTRYFEHKAEWTQSFENLSGKEERLQRIKLHPRYGYGLTDSIFLSSTDYVNFEVGDGVFMGPGIESEQVDNWIYGACYHAQNGIFETVNKATQQREMSILTKVGSWHENSSLLRSTLRVDGFASLSARAQKKVVVTKPFVYDGNALSLNISTSAKGGVFVTLTCEEQSVRSYEVIGDSLDKKVSFPNFNVSQFSGKEVVMSIELDEADVYSFKFNQ